MRALKNQISLSFPVLSYTRTAKAPSLCVCPCVCTCQTPTWPCQTPTVPTSATQTRPLAATPSGTAVRSDSFHVAVVDGVKGCESGSILKEWHFKGVTKQRSVINIVLERSLPNLTWLKKQEVYTSILTTLCNWEEAGIGSLPLFSHCHEMSLLWNWYLICYSFVWSLLWNATPLNITGGSRQIHNT